MNMPSAFYQQGEEEHGHGSGIERVQGKEQWSSITSKYPLLACSACYVLLIIVTSAAGTVPYPSWWMSRDLEHLQT